MFFQRRLIRWLLPTTDRALKLVAEGFGLAARVSIPLQIRVVLQFHPKPLLTAKILAAEVRDGPEPVVDEAEAVFQALKKYLCFDEQACVCSSAKVTFSDRRYWTHCSLTTHSGEDVLLITLVALHPCREAEEQDLLFRLASTEHVTRAADALFAMALHDAEGIAIGKNGVASLAQGAPPIGLPLCAEEQAALVVRIRSLFALDRSASGAMPMASITREVGQYGSRSFVLRTAPQPKESLLLFAVQTAQ